MRGLLVGCERSVACEHFVEEELPRLRYVLMDLKFFHALLFPRFGKKLPQHSRDGIFFARVGFPKRGNDETLAGFSRIHRLSPSILTWHSPQSATCERMARAVALMLRCAPNQHGGRLVTEPVQCPRSLWGG